MTKVKKIRCPECNSSQTHLRLVRSPGLVCRNCGKFVPMEELEKNVVSSEKCPSCGGIIKNNRCQICNAKKVQGVFVYGKECEKEREEIKEENKQKKQKEKPKIYICEFCGEEIEIEKNIRRSLWDSVEWVECPECGEMKKKKEVYKEVYDE